MPSFGQAKDWIRRAGCWIGLLWLMVTMSPVIAQSEERTSQSATQIVEGFQAKLLAVMKDAKKLGYQGRFDLLAPAVRATHDLPGVVKIAVGKAWTTLNGEQKELLTVTFSDLSIATYAYQFDDYGGESFRTVSTEALPNGMEIVHTVLVKSDGEEVPLDYMLRDKSGRWVIVNIIADGVSDLALKRSEYTSIINREGFGGLIVKLKEKIAEYSAPGATPS